MSKIKVTLDHTIYDGMDIITNAPCDCSEVTGLTVYYPQSDNKMTSQEFTFVDAHKNDLSNLGTLFVSGARIKMNIDTVNNHAYIQNADTNAYLEKRFDSIITKNMIPASDHISVTQNMIDDGIKITNVSVMGDDITIDSISWLNSFEEGGYYTETVIVPYRSTITIDAPISQGKLGYNLTINSYDNNGLLVDCGYKLHDDLISNLKSEIESLKIRIYELENK